MTSETAYAQGSDFHGAALDQVTNKETYCSHFPSVRQLLRVIGMRSLKTCSHSASPGRLQPVYFADRAISDSELQNI